MRKIENGLTYCKVVSNFIRDTCCRSGNEKVYMAQLRDWTIKAAQPCWCTMTAFSKRSRSSTYSAIFGPSTL
jgi:hypothetical protein